MKDHIKLTTESARTKLNFPERKHCFEIFGYDFILDEELNTWLIEINTNPCIEESSPLLQKLLPRMLSKFIFLISDDAFKITLDNLFPKYKRVCVSLMQNEPRCNT
jgi:hypothetical protein